MATKKTAAIKDIREATLDSISAADFLGALNAGSAARHIAVWPEKKKYELWVEPENIGRIKVGRLLDILRGEKKKIEIEKSPSWERWTEFEIPGRPPVFDQLVDQVAAEVEKRLRG